MRMLEKSHWVEVSKEDMINLLKGHFLEACENRGLTANLTYNGQGIDFALSNAKGSIGVVKLQFDRPMPGDKGFFWKEIVQIDGEESTEFGSGTERQSDMKFCAQALANCVVEWIGENDIDEESH